jgi:hypothetical protein
VCVGGITSVKQPMTPCSLPLPPPPPTHHTTHCTHTCTPIPQLLHSAATEGRLAAIEETVVGLGEGAAPGVLNRPFKVRVVRAALARVVCLVCGVCVLAGVSSVCSPSLSCMHHTPM